MKNMKELLHSSGTNFSYFVLYFKFAILREEILHFMKEDLKVIWG